MVERLSRRDVAALSIGLGSTALYGSLFEAQAQADKTLLRRAITHGKGETIPVVGVGTSEVFDVGPNPTDQAGPTAVVQALISAGGSLIDTAPSYGEAE